MNISVQRQMCLVYEEHWHAETNTSFDSSPIFGRADKVRSKKVRAKWYGVDELCIKSCNV
jgi:hypothetical protein